jgi:outer membrane protein TolC
MKMAENRLRASSEGIGIAVSQLLPSIHLDMITGLTSGNSQYTIPVEPIYFNDQLVTAPLLKFSALGEIAKARGLDKVSYYHYIDTLQKALRDTTNALANNEHLNNKLQQTIHAQQRLAKAYDLNWRLYQRGIENYLETLKNKIVLDKINIDVNQDKLQQLISMVRLYEELAGGYKEGQDEINRPKFSLKKRG